MGAVIIGCGYEYALKHYRLEEYILNAPRVDLVSANREGLFGCIGFVTCRVRDLNLRVEGLGFVKGS